MQAANRLFAELHREGKTKALHRVGCIGVVPGMNGVVAVNTQHTHDIDGTDTAAVTRAFIAGRREIAEAVELFRKHLQGFENAFLLDTALMLGVRETRRIRGRYALTAEDILRARDFEDGIGRNAYDLDLHLDETVEERFLKPGTSYAIPYRCLLPEGLDNLLVAGRCLSATHQAQSSIRIMPCCMVTGEAAGIAAALSVRGGLQPAALDIALLRQAIRAAGGIV